MTNPEYERESDTDVRTAPLYELVLFDDDDHSYDYVMEMIILLFGRTQDEAFQVAYEVDHIGEAVVKSCPREEALAGVKAIHSFGPDPNIPRCQGSMSAMAREL